MNEMLQTTGFSSISCVDLNTQFRDRCHTDWSQSNIISIVTPDGIYLLKPQLELEHGPFRVEMIKNPSAQFRHDPISRLHPTFDSMWQLLSGQQYMQVFTDPSLMTNVDTISLDVYNRQYSVAKWSPVIGKIYPSRCLLATLTTDYQLMVFSREPTCWLVVADLSSDYDAIWSAHHQVPSKNAEKLDAKRIKFSTDVDKLFEAIRNDIHSLSFCCMCWSERTSSFEQQLLLAATTNGDIVIWQLQINSERGTSETSVEMQFLVKTILSTNLSFMRGMELVDSLLICTSRDGQVVLYDLATYLTDSSSIDSEAQQFDGTTKSICNSPTAILWHSDGIEVTDFYIQRLGDDIFRIVLAKATNICWSILKYCKAADGQPATLVISDSFSAIDGLDPEITLHQNPASWMRPSGNHRAVLTADDGSFFLLEFMDDRQDSSPNFNAISTGRISLTNLVPRGLCVSPNGHLMTMISCLSLLYEPIKITAPSKLILLPVINDTRFFVDCLDCLLSDTWLSQERVESPMDVCDRIDYLRSVFPLLSSEQHDEFLKTLVDNIESIGCPKDQTQAARLKIVGLLLRKLRYYDNSRQALIEYTSTEDDAELDEVYESLLLRHIERVLEAYSHSHDMTIDHMKSLSNYFSWLDKSSKEEAKNLREKHMDKRSETAPETCHVCDDRVPFVSAKYGACGRGHKFERCARSLLLVTLRANDKSEFVCEDCGLHYETRLLWPSAHHGLKNQWTCLVCQ